MMKVFLATMLLVLSGCSLSPTNSSSSTKAFRCDFLVGSWSGSYSSKKWKFSSTFVSEYFPQGIYRGYFTVVGNEDLKEPNTQELRTWFCDGVTFGTFLVETSDGISPDEAIASHKVYEIIELTESYRKYKTIIGNEVGKEYESYKLPEP